jgi:hypothetical protein
MEYEIRNLSWFKRREPTKDPQPVKVEINNIELVNNSYCDMIVEYDDGKIFEFNGRVNLNDIKNTWTVHGFSSASGRQCFVDVVE